MQGLCRRGKLIKLETVKSRKKAVLEKHSDLDKRVAPASD